MKKIINIISFAIIFLFSVPAHGLMSISSGIPGYNSDFVFQIYNDQKNVDAGTADTTTPNKLIDTTQTDFLTTVEIDFIVHNVTDDTWAIVENVDSNTTLSLDADIMVSGKEYIIYDPKFIINGTYLFPNFDAYIDWGDGTGITNWTSYLTPATHTYTSINSFTITISGYMPHVRFIATGDKLALRTIENLGDVGWKYFNSSFIGSTNITELNLKHGDFSEVQDMGNMLKGITGVTTISYISGWNISNVTSLANWTEGMTGLLVSPTVKDWNTSSVFNFTGIFFGHLNTAAPPDVRNWDVSNGLSFWESFASCPWTTPPDVSLWDVSSAQDFNEMFSNCSNLVDPPDVSNWVTSNLSFATLAGPDPAHGGALFRTFHNTSSLTTPPNVRNWDVSNVKYRGFYETFYLMSSVEDPPDVSLWDVTGGVYDATRMFRDMISLLYPPDISNWDTSNFTDITEMFRGLISLIEPIDIGAIDIDSIVNNSRCFYAVSNAAINTTGINSFILHAYEKSSYAGGTGIAGTGLNWDFGPDTNDCFTDSDSVNIGNSGTTTGDNADDLIDSGGTPDFLTTVEQFDCVHNVTDDTWAIITGIENNNTLSISPDIMDISEAYTIEDKTDVECAYEALSIPSKDNLSFTLNDGAVALGSCGPAATTTTTTTLATTTTTTLATTTTTTLATTTTTTTPTTTTTTTPTTTTTTIPISTWADFPWHHSFLADDLATGTGCSGDTCEDGEDIQTWADEQAGSENLTYFGVAPSYDVDGCPNSSPAVDFLTDERLRNLTLTCGDPCTVVFIFRWSVTPTQSDTLLADVGGDYRVEIYYDSGNMKYSAGTAITGEATDTSFHALRWFLDGTVGGTTPWQLDDNTAANNDAGETDIGGGIYIASNRFGNGNFADVDICAIGFYEGDATALGSTWDNLVDYVCTKWGLSLGTTCTP